MSSDRILEILMKSGLDVGAAKAAAMEIAAMEAASCKASDAKAEESLNLAQQERGAGEQGSRGGSQSALEQPQKQPPGSAKNPEPAAAQQAQEDLPNRKTTRAQEDRDDDPRTKNDEPDGVASRTTVSDPGVTRAASVAKPVAEARPIAPAEADFRQHVDSVAAGQELLLRQAAALLAVCDDNQKRHAAILEKVLSMLDKTAGALNGFDSRLAALQARIERLRAQVKHYPQ